LLIGRLNLDMTGYQMWIPNVVLDVFGSQDKHSSNKRLILITEC